MIFQKCRLKSVKVFLVFEEIYMYRKWTFKYATFAVLLAVAIIAVSLLALPQGPIQPVQGSTVAILLTDPPTVPEGTTQLNLTYSDFALHVTYPDETSEWVPVTATGTVNLFSLINVTKTIATTTLPINSTLDKVQFTIKNVTAVVNSETYNVTALSDTFVVNVNNGKFNQTLSGVIIDFNPTLVQIQAFDENGTALQYYVLVPSANAVVVNDLSKKHIEVGTIIEIGENNKVRIQQVKEEIEKNVTIVSATLTVKGNQTGLSVTLKNEGNVAFKISGLTLHGEFNVTRVQTKIHDSEKHDHDDDDDDENYQNGYDAATVTTMNRTGTLPFKLFESTLIPLLQVGDEHDEHGFSSVTLQSGETITVSFTGIIALNDDKDHGYSPVFTIAPLVDGNYTIRLGGEGSQPFVVKATAAP